MFKLVSEDKQRKSTVLQIIKKSVPSGRGRKDGHRKEGVALVLPSILASACVAWAPVSERLLFARFRHSLGHASIVVCYAPTDCSPTAITEQFYTDLEATLSRSGKNDLKIVLGDLNAETGSLRQPGDTSFGPWGIGTTNENSYLFLSFCRVRRLSIAGSWFRRKDIHRFSWISGDHHTRKEIEHVLISRGKCVQQCRVYRSFEVDSDHFPVVARLRIKLKRTGQRKIQPFRPNLQRVEDMETRRQFSRAVAEALISETPPSVESMWSGYKTALNTEARSVLGPAKCTRKSRISENTLSTIEKRRKAALTGDMEEYRRLAGDRRRALRSDKRQGAESIALEGEEYLQGGQIRDAFANFKRLRLNQTKIFSQLFSADGNNLLSDGASTVTRWREYFSALLNRPLVDPPPSLTQAASEAMVDSSVPIEPPSISEKIQGNSED